QSRMQPSTSRMPVMPVGNEPVAISIITPALAMLVAPLGRRQFPPWHALAYSTARMPAAYEPSPSTTAPSWYVTRNVPSPESAFMSWHVGQVPPSVRTRRLWLSTRYALGSSVAPSITTEVMVPTSVGRTISSTFVHPHESLRQPQALSHWPPAPMYGEKTHPAYPAQEPLAIVGAVSQDDGMHRGEHGRSTTGQPPTLNAVSILSVCTARASARAATASPAGSGMRGPDGSSGFSMVV